MNGTGAIWDEATGALGEPTTGIGAARVEPVGAEPAGIEPVGAEPAGIELLLDAEPAGAGAEDTGAAGAEPPAAGAGREERRTPVPRRDAFGASSFGSASLTGSCATGGRAESPTAMMRIAKMAEGEVDGGGNPGGGLEADGAGAAEVEARAFGEAASDVAGDESARKRGPGGSLRGRGGLAIGRGAFEASFGLGASPPAFVDSDGVVLGVSLAAVALPGGTSAKEGLERRRMGGG